MGQKIAIIDDNRSLCESLRLALTMEGFEIDTYVNGEVRCKEFKNDQLI